MTDTELSGCFDLVITYNPYCIDRTSDFSHLQVKPCLLVSKKTPEPISKVNLSFVVHVLEIIEL